MKSKVFCSFVCSIVFLSGCTSIHIHSKDGNVDVRHGIGVVNVSFPEKEMPFLIDAKGFGVTKIGYSFTIGYTQQKIATLDESCRVVFWIEDAAQSERIVELLKSVGDVCVLNSSITKQEK